jgi:predicted RNA-binding protein with PIN domain
MSSGRIVHWIVDGMNVIGTRPDDWWKDRHDAMLKIVAKLDDWADTLNPSDRVAVVFEREPKPPIESKSVAVCFAPRSAPNSADDEIVRLVKAAPRPGDITVVTSDSGLSARTRDAGALVHSASNFRRLIDSI